MNDSNQHQLGDKRFTIDIFLYVKVKFPRDENESQRFPHLDKSCRSDQVVPSRLLHNLPQPVFFCLTIQINHVNIQSLTAIFHSGTHKVSSVVPETGWRGRWARKHFGGCLYIFCIINPQQLSSKDVVAFWVTNPCRITRKEFLMKQTKMYVCTLEEFILVDIWIHCCASWNCTVLYCTRS